MLRFVTAGLNVLLVVMPVKANSLGRRSWSVGKSRSVPVGGEALRRHLERDRDAESVVVARPVAPEDPTAPNAEQRAGPISL